MRLMLIALVMIPGFSAPARAGPPDPALSDVDPCIITCPAGDSVFTAIVRYGNGAQYDPGGEAEVDLCGCPGVHFAPVAARAPYWLIGCTVWTLTDAQGIAHFPLAAGGGCSGASIRVIVDRVPIRVLSSVASFDQNADLVVDASDLALIEAKRGTADKTADFDCDGAVTDADVAIAAQHLGHHDASIVGVGNDPTVEFGVRPAPNPSRGTVDFILRSPAAGRAVLAVHDLSGRRLVTVLDREIESGVQHVAWSGRDEAGRSVAAGLYFYRLTLGTKRSQGLLVITR